MMQLNAVDRVALALDPSVLTSRYLGLAVYQATATPSPVRALTSTTGNASQRQTGL